MVEGGPSPPLSRRNFTKDVIAGGAVASTLYLRKRLQWCSATNQASRGQRSAAITQNVAPARVLVDGLPHDSCSFFAHRARGKQITTIEGLTDPVTGKLSAVQQDVIDEQGFQCAFCMPGFVMTATGYLMTNPTHARGTRTRRVRQPVPLPGITTRF